MFSKRGKSAKRGSSVARASAGRVVRDSHREVVFGLLGNTFAVGLSTYFPTSKLSEIFLTQLNMAAKLLHAGNNDLEADVIVVPDDVFDEHDGRLNRDSLGLDQHTINAVLAANPSAKRVSLSHFFTCLPLADRTSILAKLQHSLPAKQRPSTAAIKTYLSGLPKLCVSGEVHYGDEALSKVQMIEMLKSCGIPYSTQCLQHDAVILGDSNQASKFAHGTNVTLLNMEQFKALQSVKTHVTLARVFSQLMAQEAAAAHQAAIVAAEEAEYATKPPKRGGSKKRGASQKRLSAAPSHAAAAVVPKRRGRVVGRAEEETSFEDEDLVTDAPVVGEEEDAFEAWDRICF